MAAAVFKGTARRQIQQRRHNTLNLLQRFTPTILAWHTTKKSVCVRVHRAANQRFVWPLLNDTSGIHHTDAAGDAGYDSQIMRDP